MSGRDAPGSPLPNYLCGCGARGYVAGVGTGQYRERNHVMDAKRFDTLTCWLAESRSRRSALATLLGGTLGLLGLTDIAAKKKGKGKKKKKRRDQGTSPSPPPPPPGPAAPPPSCLDGIKNGSESDVDCGGSCPRCADGRTCATGDDCASFRCSGGTCQACLNYCGSDANGNCYCAQPVAGGSQTCTTNSSTGPFPNCGSCPTGAICYVIPGGVGCVQPCGAP